MRATSNHRSRAAFARRAQRRRGARSFGALAAAAVLVTMIDAAPSVALVPSGSGGGGETTLSAGTAADATGLSVFEINGRPYGVSTAVHVLTFTGTGYKVAIGLAHHAIDGGRETPSSMCRTTAGCVAAVNGDFFAISRRGAPDPGDLVGGVIKDCVLLHTPEISHQQANLDTQSVSGGLNWSSSLEIAGAAVPITAVNRQVPLSYANVHVPLRGILLFTPAFALPTPSAPGWVTYQFAQVDPSVDATTINATTQLELLSTTTQPVRVTAGQVDVAAFAGSALATLHPGDLVNLTTTSSAGCDSIGGHPILLNKGVVTPVAPADTYMAKPFARTVVGWTAAGGTVLMTVAGRDGRSGATAHQLVALLQSLGVVTALDLDGGMSTTFFARGRVYTSSAHVRERRVSTSLLVVQST